jgi:hypothetical protein
MKAPQPLRLDHFGPERHTGRAGWILLTAAVLCAAVLAMWQHALVQQLDAAERRAARATPAAAVLPATFDPRRLDDAARRAQAVAAELRLPWAELFDAVEAAADPSVALLAIEPDARRAALRVSGEARDKPAMLAYLTRLGAQPPIARALLESHAERGEGRRVQFTLIAHWELRP